MAQYGPQAITYQEILAWATLTGRDPLAYEIDALLDLDSAVRAAMLSD